jgi:hypothetical protein
VAKNTESLLETPGTNLLRVEIYHYRIIDKHRKRFWKHEQENLECRSYILDRNGCDDIIVMYLYGNTS